MRGQRLLPARAGAFDAGLTAARDAPVIIIINHAAPAADLLPKRSNYRGGPARSLFCPAGTAFPRPTLFDCSWIRVHLRRRKCSSERYAYAKTILSISNANFLRGAN